MSAQFHAAVRILLLSLTVPAIHSSMAQPAPQKQATSEALDRLVIDLSTDTGPVLHGASGWLYGQSAPAIPTVSIMEPLHPQISAQKPDGGLQHPMADASLVAPDFRAAGGKLMQIYMQDIYPDWTYNDLGIDDYLRKVDAMTRQVVADPNHDLFVYVPFNEPNNNWYADNGPKFTKFMHDWMLVYREIRSIDPGAKIAGPGFEHFNGAAFETFLQFARDKQVLPDEFTWHELHDDFFPQWYGRVDQYRASETKLGIAHLPIVINEYARDRGDLAVPGNLVQWVTRLENSKVYGCLAFWTPSGTLADLTARIWPNRPTGAWWLYRWYGSLTGNTVKVSPPDPDAPGLQGVAAFDDARQQVRMIFGGTAKPITLDFRGLEKIAAFKAGIHVSLSRIASSGIEPSLRPEPIEEKNQSLSGGQLVLAVPAASADTAYSLIMTPAVAYASDEVRGEQSLMAVDEDFTAKAVYSDPRGSMVILGASGRSKRESVRFIANAAKDAYYAVSLKYRADKSSSVQFVLDDEQARTLTLASHTGQDWGTETLRVFLAAGVHRFRFSLVDAQAVAPLSIGELSLQTAAGAITPYKATSRDESDGKTLQASRSSGPEVQPGAASIIEYRHVRAQESGEYAMVVTYANSEKGHKGQVDEKADISINDEPSRSVWFRNTFTDTATATTVIRIHLQAGENRIRIAAPKGHAPSIANMQVAKEYE